MKRLTLRAVNEAVKKAGMKDVTLYQGRGYLYFFGDGVVNQSHSVAVCRLNHLTLARWIEEAIEATTPAPTLEWMLPRSRTKTTGVEAAVRSLREAHRAVKKAVQEWAAKDEAGRDVIASDGECSMTLRRYGSSIVVAMYVWREHPEFFRGAGGLIQRLRWWPSSYDVQTRLIETACLRDNDLPRPSEECVTLPARHLS